MDFELPDYTRIINNLNNYIDLVGLDFMKTGYDNVSSYLQAPFAAATILLIVLMGYGLLMGFIEMRTKELNKIALIIGVVQIFAFNYSGFFSSVCYELFFNVTGEISNLLMGGKITVLNWILPNAGEGIAGALQTILTETWKISAWTVAKGGLFSDWLPLFVGGSFLCIGTFVVWLAASEYLFIKLVMLVLFSVAPFFFVCLLFPFTKNLFEGWIRELKGWAMVAILISAAVALAMNFMHWAVGGYYANHAANITLFSVAPLCILGGLSTLILIVMIPVGKHIAGGSMGSAGFALAGGAIGGMLGKTMRAGGKGLQGAKGAGSLGMKGMKALSPTGNLSNMAGTIGKSAIEGSKSLYSSIRKQSQSGNVNDKGLSNPLTHQGASNVR